MVKLTILVPTLETRKHWLKRLMLCLQPQLTDEVEVLTELDNGEISTGAKRNILVARAAVSNPNGYLVHVDDDDLLEADFCKTVLEAMKADRDCVGYWLKRYLNGKHVEYSQHSMRNEYQPVAIMLDGKKTLLRPINHTQPVKVALAVKAPFPDCTSGEDRAYAKALAPLLKSETFIDKVMYHYYFRTEGNRKGEKTCRDRGRW